MDFKNLSYLADGSKIQQKAFQVLKSSEIMELLAEFDPIVVGTIPLDIAIEGSDLDIICQWKDSDDFKNALRYNFASYPMFRVFEKEISSISSIIAQFQIDDLKIEIFGQDLPTMQQYGYRHMLIEYQILKARGATFKSQVIALKQSGSKTEPAFCQLLGIEGDSYENLLIL
ncbi:MAG: DUF4269 domain-containing protein [Bacteroidota bacterium]